MCAVEHRDGSEARTFVNHPAEGKGSRKEREANGRVDHLDKEAIYSWDVIDFIFPSETHTIPDRPMKQESTRNFALPKLICVSLKSMKCMTL